MEASRQPTEEPTAVPEPKQQATGERPERKTTEYVILRQIKGQEFDRPTYEVVAATNATSKNQAIKNVATDVLADVPEESDGSRTVSLCAVPQRSFDETRVRSESKPTVTIS